MKKSLVILILVVLVLSVSIATIQADAEEDIYNFSANAYGINPDNTGACSVEIGYSTDPYWTFLNVRQRGYGNGCPTHYIYLRGDDVPRDLFHIGNAAVEDYVGDVVNFSLDGLSWSFNVTTNLTYESEGKRTYYPSGDMFKDEYKVNSFDIHSFVHEGVTYTVPPYSYGSGNLAKIEFD